MIYIKYFAGATHNGSQESTVYLSLFPILHSSMLQKLKLRFAEFTTNQTFHDYNNDNDDNILIMHTFSKCLYHLKKI